MSTETYVNFGSVARNQMNMQAQYAARHLFPGNPRFVYLGENLRIEGSLEDYHGITIHEDDVAVLLDRYQTYKNRVR